MSRDASCGGHGFPISLEGFPQGNEEEGVGDGGQSKQSAAGGAALIKNKNLRNKKTSFI